MADNYGPLHDKLTLIFWPYVRLALLFLLAYAAADAALLAWFPGFEPPEDLWKMGLPLLLSSVLVLLLLWPRLRLLEGANERQDWRFFLALLAVAVMTCAAVCAHGYLRDALGHLAELPSSAAVRVEQPLARYYRFGHTFLSPRYGSGKVTFNTSNKGGRLNFHLYVSTPVLASPADTLRPMAIWLGTHYTDDIGTSASNEEKEAAYQAFIKRSEAEYNQEKFANPLGYYTRLPNTDAREAYVQAIRRSAFCPPDTTLPLLVLQPADAPFTGRGRSSGYWLLGWVLGGSVVFFGLLLVPYLSPTGAQEFRAGQQERLDYFDWLRPQRGFWLTPLLLIANGGVYLAMALSTHSGLESFANSVLLTWGANYGPAVAQGQWWRLLSSVFLHGGLLHLGNNMVLLWLLGSLLEKPVGTVRLTIIYLLAGLGSSLLSSWWHPATVSIGASGAIFGLMGAALVLAWRRALPTGLRGVVFTIILAMGVINLALGFFLPGIDNAAHLGGLFTGAVLGLLFSPGLVRRLPLYEMTEDED